MLSRFSPELTAYVAVQVNSNRRGDVTKKRCPSMNSSEVSLCEPQLGLWKLEMCVYGGVLIELEALGQGWLKEHQMIETWNTGQHFRIMTRLASRT